MVISQQAKGLRVWGGRNMHLLFEIPSEVEAFLVSPCEKYIVIKTANDLSVHNMRTAKKIRTLTNLDLNNEDLWPVTRFSADDTLVAVCKTGYNLAAPDVIGSGKLNIYIASTMKMLQSNNKVPQGHTFEISGLYKAE
uniref:Eukaryotic translation initiation factor 3 subunit B n=1 Tax=Lygus hesperus TaxID=30085 RepID=A0A0A9VUS1_LYGHE